MLQRGRGLPSRNFSRHACFGTAALITIDNGGSKTLFVYELELLRRLHLFEGVVGRANERA